MSNKQLTVLIGGREALLVRAIPYVTGWQRFSPDFIANNLAQNFKLIWCDGNAGLTAYHLSNGIPIVVHPREWDAIVVNLKSFEAKLRQENPNDDIGYAAWRADAVSLLPSDAFVWLDEFKKKYQADKESLLYFETKPSNAELILTPLLDSNTRAIVVEGVTGILYQRFSDYSDMPASELPKFAPAWWDSLGVEKRQELAKCFCGILDPLLENEQQQMDFILGDYSIPDEWGHWAEKPTLLADEAIPLMNGLDPKSWRNRNERTPPLPDDMVAAITRALRIAETDECVTKSPADWLEWGRSHGLDKPAMKTNERLLEPDMCMWPLFAQAVHEAAPTGKVKKKRRTNETRAFLLACFNQGIEKNIESVWLYIHNNAGKPNFLFKSRSQSQATTVDDKTVKKVDLERTLNRLIKAE